MYIFISSLLSLAIAVIIYIPVKRLNNSSALFSAALGIIIFGCIKSVFAECGWGYAALFDIKTGMIIQIIVFITSFVFFRELHRECDVKIYGSLLPEIITIFCFETGRHLMRNYTEFSDITAYILGEAVNFTLTAIALFVTEDDFWENFSGTEVVLFGAVLILRAGVSVIYQALGGNEGDFGVLVLLTVGTAGLACEFIKALDERRNISAIGFAVGLTIAFCFDALTE